MSTVAGLVIALSACASERQTRAGLTSPNAVDRAAAAVAVGERRDADAVHGLIGLLDDPDLAVRLYAIESLRQMTGEDFGYRYYAPDAERAAAIARWQEAARSGALTVHRAAARSPVAPATGSTTTHPASPDAADRTAGEAAPVR